MQLPEIAAQRWAAVFYQMEQEFMVFTINIYRCLPNSACYHSHTVHFCSDVENMQLHILCVGVMRKCTVALLASGSREEDHLVLDSLAWCELPSKLSCVSFQYESSTWIPWLQFTAVALGQTCLSSSGWPQLSPVESRRKLMAGLEVMWPPCPAGYSAGSLFLGFREMLSILLDVSIRKWSLLPGCFSNSWCFYPFSF